MRYTSILLDYDGTLVNSRPSIVDATHGLFAQLDRTPPPDSSIMAAVAEGKGLRYALSCVLPGADDALLDDAVARWRAYYMQHSAHLTTLFDGALETLTKLHGAGVRLAIASNKGHEQLCKDVREKGIEPLVEVTAGDRKGHPVKPQAAYYDEYFRATFGKPGAGMLYVGDSQADMAFAQNIGAHGCWARYGYGDEAKAMAYSPAHTIDDVRKLVDLVL